MSAKRYPQGEAAKRRARAAWNEIVLAGWAAQLEKPPWKPSDVRQAIESTIAQAILRGVRAEQDRVRRQRRSR